MAQRKLDGTRLQVLRKASLNLLMLRKPAANAISPNGILVPVIKPVADCKRHVTATCRGFASTCLMNKCDRCRGPMPRQAARSSTDCPSRKPSLIRRRPRFTVVAVPRHSGLPGALSGRQRKHGRNSTLSAAAAVGTKKLFLNGRELPVRWEDNKSW